MKKVIWITLGILLAAGLSAASFWGGMIYQFNQAEQTRANFFNARGGTNGGQVLDGSLDPNNGPGRGFFGGGGTTGQVKSIEGNVLTLSTAQAVTTVNLTEATQIEKSAAGTLDDLQLGIRILVTGERDSDGNMTASRIQILSSTAAGGNFPAPAGTAP